MLKEQTRAIERPGAAGAPPARGAGRVRAGAAPRAEADFDPFLHGVELVYAKLLDSLRAEGLERIDAAGQALRSRAPRGAHADGEGDGEPVVDDVFRQGYRMRGRVLRPAGVKVVVGDGRKATT